MRLRGQLLARVMLFGVLLVVQTVLTIVFIQQLQRTVAKMEEALATQSQLKQLSVATQAYVEQLSKEGTNLAAQSVVQAIDLYHTDIDIRGQALAQIDGTLGLSTELVGGLIEALNELRTESQLLLSMLSEADDDFIDQALFVELSLGELADAVGRLEIELSNKITSLVVEQRELRNRPTILAATFCGLTLLVVLWFGWQFAGKITRPVQRLATQLNKMARGDIDQQPLPLVGQDEVTDLSRSMNQMLDRLNGVIGEIQSSSTIVTEGAGRIADENRNLSRRTEHQAASLEETAATIEELFATIQENTSNSTSAAETAQLVTTEADVSGKAVDAAMLTMQRAAEVSQQVGEVIELVEGIAFQTNILALNAAVEAARAGDNGLGFAVVAHEVRTLANRTAAMAKDVKGLVGAVTKEVEEGKRQIDTSGAALTSIRSSIEQLAQAVASISQASGQQLAAANQTSDAITDLERMTQENAGLVGAVASAADSMSKQAASLNEQIAFFGRDAGSKER